MQPPADPAQRAPQRPALTDDEQALLRLGYRQELARRMSGFSNFAISLSIICILAGGITSFQYGFCAAGGAAIGLGWPLVCLFSMVVALTMAQVASAFPTAGGLYHWASILGGRACGWVTAWFNLLGLITVLAAINSGTYDFIVAAFQWPTGAHPQAWKVSAVAVITLSQAVFNHLGIRLTTRLTDFSGYLILLVATLLTVALLWFANSLDLSRLFTFTNYSGLPSENPVMPRSNHLLWLFVLGFLLPAYTITGFDASAHTAEETLSAATHAPRGIIRSVAVSGIFGWVMLSAIVLAMPDPDQAAQQGHNVFYWTVRSVLPAPLVTGLFVGISLTQYCCGLAAMTSASRMMFAFARDGGLPGSVWLRLVSAAGSPAPAIWTIALLALAFTICIPYSAIAASCAVFLYISYVLPTAAGFFAYGRSWTRMGPWQLGTWYRPLSVVAVLGCVGLIIIGVQPPNEIAVKILGGMVLLMVLVWFGLERKRFPGPPPVK